MTGEVEHKLSQFADDTTLILDGSVGSFRRAIEVLDGFQVTSGLKVNYEKTKVLWVGSAKNRGPIECNKPDISWVEGKVFALGVWFATDRNVMLRSNYDERIGKIKNVIEIWQFRRLTLLGKMTLIKSLLVSQLIYILTPLPTDTNVLQTVNGDKIKREHIIRDYEKGGLRMVDIHTFNKSLKTSWIKKYLDPTNNGRWKFFFDDNLKMYGGKFIFSCNLHKDDIPLLKIRNPFCM